MIKIKLSVLLSLIIVMINAPLILAADIYNNDSGRTSSGSNYYGTSNIREWLNSYEADVSYTHNEPNGANVNSGQNNYEDEKGFLADGNFTSVERTMIAPRTHKVLLADIDSNVKDGGTASHIYDNTPINEAVSNYDSAYYKMFTDRVFLLSVQEINNWVAARGWDYKAKPTAQAVANSEFLSTGLNTSSFWYYWLNTPATNSYDVRYVASSGTVISSFAYHRVIGVRPALNLKSEITKSSGAGTSSDPATLGTGGGTLAVGDYVTFGKYYNQPITWRVINKDSQGTVLFAENILTIKPYDAKGDGTYPELAKTYGEVEPLPGPDTTPPEEVGSLAETHTETTIKLTWVNPGDEDFSHLIIYKDGVVVDSNVTTESIVIEGLEAATTYTFKVVSVDKTGNKSAGRTIAVTTKEIKVDEVSNLKANTNFDRVNISWNNPESDYFHHVNIYRKQVEEKSFFEKLFSGISVYAAETTDGFTPMFETNGTYWNDLTVASDTTYEYKLTTESTTGKESTGQILEVKTLEEPSPEMGGEEVTTDEKGDYKVTWTSPISGKVKILVDGSEYAEVDASSKEYVIPKADMVYDLFGKPKVQLVAVSDSGKEGKPTKPPVDGEPSESMGVTMPFTANDFLKTVMSLIALIAPFVLLLLAIRFAPRIIQFLKGVMTKYKEGKLKL
ncbi:DUF6273 domain-containing protein [Schinkia sp. CFF1]